MTDQTRLRVTIDARALDGALMGTQIHVLELVRALARTGALRLRVLVRGERIDRATRASLDELPGSEILAAEDVDDSTPRSDVFHRPQQTFSAGDVALAWRLGERFVLSQLDLIAYRSPAYFPDAGAWEDYRRASRHGMFAAERVVVFSEHTRHELLTDVLADAERIRVVAPGLNHRSGEEPQMPPALDARTPEGSAGDGSSTEEEPGFLLCLGTDYEHKNRVFALRMLAALREQHGWRGRLVLAGTHVAHGSSRELEREELDARPELREAVIDLGSVEEAEKEWLMEHAGAVLYPSRYEGFGLVPFEAALRGVPCSFAPQSSLAEGAAGRAATIVPWDPVPSAAAAYALLSDPAARARHVQLLAAAAHELTWERAAAETVDVYREAVRAPVRDAATLSRDAVARERELTGAHQSVVQTLIGERELVLRDYNELLAEVGPGRSLVGPRGSLPEDLQRALLALSAHPALSRPLYGLAASAFRAARALARAVHRPRRRG
jgi:glycosyltransferase involved in cell wall biosynthesis